MKTIIVEFSNGTKTTYDEIRSPKGFIKWLERTYNSEISNVWIVKKKPNAFTKFLFNTAKVVFISLFIVFIVLPIILSTLNII